MNKIKTTAKAVRDAFDKKIALECCEAVELLRAHYPLLYTSGMYGWNFDVYIVDGVAICTGFRGMTGIRPAHELVKAYEDRARDIWNEFDRPYKEQVEQVDALLMSFISEVLGEWYS